MLCAVVMMVTKALKWARPEQMLNTAMRGDVVTDIRWRNYLVVQAHDAQWIIIKVSMPYALPPR
jgi:hypothetical protein